MTRQELEAEITAYATQLGLDIDVISDGPINAEIAIIGEGLGETEVRRHLTWSGGAGKFLWDALRRYKLGRHNVYSTNVVKRQISLSNNDDDKHAVHRDEQQAWSSVLRYELELLPNVRIVVLMGNMAMEALLDYKGVGNWRGSVIDLDLPNHKKGKAVITFNPAFILRDLKNEPAFRFDIHKVDLVNRNVFKAHKVETHVNPTFKEAIEFIRELKSGVVSHNKPMIGYDIEFINGATACYGLSNNSYRAMCINVRDMKDNRFTLTQEADLLLAMQDLFDTPRIEVVAQNGQFDGYWSWIKDHLRVRIHDDTLLGHHTLYPQMPHTLAYLVAQYTTHPYYKDDAKTWREGGDIDQYWRYNGNDTALLVAIMPKIIKELKQQGLYKFYREHVMHAHPHLVQATVHGIRQDHSLREGIIEEVNEDVAKLLAKFHKQVEAATGIVGYRPNPNSPKQLSHLLFHHLGLKGKGKSTDETNRQHMLDNPLTPPKARELIVTLNRYKEEEKFRSTYAESRASEEDGRMRCEYRQSGTQNAPGRLSSSSLLDGSGMNLQNQPPRARAMFVSDPGYVLCYFDLSQAEARVVAYRANIHKWKEQFERARVDRSYDCHRALASDMFKVEYGLVPEYDFDPVTQKYTIRYTAKRCRHGLNYRMQRSRLAEVTGLPYFEASRAFTLYHCETPELVDWWSREEKVFKQNRELYNALGRRWKVIQRINDDVLRSVVAFYPQSTVGDKVTQVWYQVEEDDKWPDPMYARICLDVHDNLVALARPKDAKTVLSIMQHYAEKPIMIQDAWGHKAEPLIIPAELKLSTLTRFETMRDKKGKPILDAKGKPMRKQIEDDTEHRWSNMTSVVL